MRAIVVTRYGGPEVLRLEEQPEPQAGPGQVLVDAEAIGVNARDRATEKTPPSSPESRGPEP